MERFLSNKVCIITGAAQGIGKSIVERFAADGLLYMLVTVQKEVWMNGLKIVWFEMVYGYFLYILM